MKTLLICIWLLLLTLTTFSQKVDDWNFIVPLSSTRSEVESRLKQPLNESCQSCVYQTEFGSVFIEYSSGVCQDFPRGWKVEKNTVLRFNIFPKAELKFDLALISKSEWVKSFSDTSTYFTQPSEGITYEVSSDERITAITRHPAKKDSALTCPGNLGLQAEGIKRPAPTLTCRTKDSKLACLDQMAIYLIQNQELVGFIINYNGKGGNVSSFDTFVRETKGYLVSVRGIATNRVTVVDGGNREEWEMELFVVPPDSAPPYPYPTFKK